MEKIESYLPVFPGFYGTILESDDYHEEDSIAEGKTWDDYEWDYDEYHQRVARASVDVVAEWLTPLGITVEFQKLVQPRQYNFGNDSVNVEFTLSDNSWSEIIEYLMENEEEFREYIKNRYTSYDGFSSHYSNDSDVWLTDYIPNKYKPEHILGALVDFYLDLEEWTEDALYEALNSQGEFYVLNELK